MPCTRNNIVPVYDSKNPFKDCLCGWMVIIGMSFIASAVTAAGIGFLLIYSPTTNSTTTTTVWPPTTTTIFIPSDTLFSNTFLRQNQYLLSKNNKYCALMLDDGSLVVYTYNFRPVTAIWSSGSGGRPLYEGPFSAMLLSYGNLVIYRAHSISIWDSGTFGKGYEPHKLVMQNDGNLVIYDGRGRSQWSSKGD